MSYTIEMLWECRYCSRRGNRGSGKHCTNCGHPKGPKDLEYFPDDTSEANAVHDVDKLREANAGPSWNCKYCEALNSTLGQCCPECGCDRATGAKPWQAKELTIESGAKPENATETQVEVPVPPKVELSPLPKKPRIPSPRAARDVPRMDLEFDPTPDDINKFKRKWDPRYLLGAVGAVALVLLLWGLFRTHIVEASVTSLAWEHKVVIERYQIESRDGWTPDPGAFDVQPMGERHHHDDRVLVGHHDEPTEERYDCRCKTERGRCRTEKGRCTSKKNGFADCESDRQVCEPDQQKCDTCTRTLHHQVDDYEMQPRYQMWYAWHVWDWSYNRAIRTAGTSTTQLSWPDEASLLPPRPLAPGEQERSSRHETYKVMFTDGDKDKHTLEPRSESEFVRYPVGKKFRLKVGIAHGVEVLP